MSEWSVGIGDIVAIHGVQWRVVALRKAQYVLEEVEFPHRKMRCGWLWLNQRFDGEVKS